MTHLINPPYLFLLASLPTPNLLHDNGLTIKASFNKLKHLHGTLPLNTACQLPHLNNPLSKIGCQILAENSIQWGAVRASFRNFDHDTALYRPSPRSCARRSLLRILGADEHGVLGCGRGHVRGQDSRYFLWDGFVIVALPLLGSARGKEKRSERLSSESEGSSEFVVMAEEDGDSHRL